MTIKDLMDRAKASLTKAEEIQAKADAEQRELTKDELTQYEGFVADAAKAQEDIDRRRKMEDAKAKAAEPIRAKANQPQTVIEPQGKVEVVGYRGRLDAYKPELFGGRAQAIETAYNVGKFLVNVAFNPQAAMSEGVNTAGGALVPTEMETAIINLLEVYGVARQLVNVRPMMSDQLDIPRITSGLTAYAINEGGSFTESDAAADVVTLTAKKWGTITKMSAELSADAIISMADLITSEAARAHAKMEDTVMIDGDGSGTYHGCQGIEWYFNNNNSAAGYVDATSAHDTFAEVDADDLGNLMAKVRPTYAKDGAAFLCSPEFKGVVFDTLQAAAGGNTYRDIAGKMMATYMGYPIYETTLLPASATNNQVMCLFGNFRLACSLGDRQGTRVKVLNELYAATDQVGIQTIRRWDFNAHDLGDTTTAGPVVALIANT